MFSRHRIRAAWLIVLVCTAPSVGVADNPSSVWEKAIQAFEASDRKSPPPEGAMLFIGSSNIARWKTLAQDFPEHKVINRGFGGSQISDSVQFAGRLVIPYKPRLIVLSAGGNDLNAKKSPEKVAADYLAFVKTVRAALPDVRIAFIAISPSPARWSQHEQQIMANRLIREAAAKGQNLDYVDLWDQYLGPNGQPREELFVADRLHYNDAGYRIRVAVMKKYLDALPK